MNIVYLTTLLSLSSLFAESPDLHRHHGAIKPPAIAETIKAVTEIPSETGKPPKSCCQSKESGETIGDYNKNYSPEHLQDGIGFHGMLFFGENNFYISHLPMFHPPHDYQAIVEVRLPEDQKRQYQGMLTKAKSEGVFFTFSPDNTFVLPEVVQKKLPISGDLYYGHFERRGSKVMKLNLELVRVVFYKKLNPLEVAGDPAPYFIFGQPGEYYQAHEVQGQPGYDEFIALNSDFNPDESVMKSLSQDGLFFSVKDIGHHQKSLYYERGDLE